ncbi:hypothetical protein M426DRAFT_192851 [Hypoxylon sp. CI-4A]|nr:hypothetical protein M426DRAFT_192851 [Hypoxylon sp. CI-4A]
MQLVHQSWSLAGVLTWCVNVPPTSLWCNLPRFVPHSPLSWDLRQLSCFFSFSPSTFAFAFASVITRSSIRVSWFWFWFWFIEN